MAEEILVKEYLSPEMISAGRLLLTRLDETNWRPTSAFWLFDLERNRWELVLSSPDVEKSGSRPGYETISRILAADESLGLSLSDISIQSPRKKIMQALPLAVSVKSGPGVRLSRSAINGHYIEDAFIYRA
jgi:hypothetical protein